MLSWDKCNTVIPSVISLILHILGIQFGNGEKLEFESIRPTEVPPFDPGRDNITLAGVSSKNWEGPYFQEASLGGVIYIPCALTPTVRMRLRKMRLIAKNEKFNWALLWVHKSWDNVVDPWEGDGRRSYNKMQVVPHWPPDMSQSLDSARLKIIDAKPIDSGVYACVVVMYGPEKGLSPIILSQADLVSVHVLRIKSGVILPPECSKEVKEISFYCRTGFEDWTQQVYVPTGNTRGDIIFQSECHADIFLTALSLGGMDPTFWKIGWRFIPLNGTDDTKAVEVDTKLHMEFTPPVHVQSADAAVPIVYSRELDRREPVVGKRDLAAAQQLAARLWRARWLVLSGTQRQESGVWQCWIEGLGMTAHPVVTSVPIRWFIEDVHLQMIERPNLYVWYNTVELWRVMALVSAPLICVLIGLTMAVGKIAAYFYPDRIPQKAQINLQFDTTKLDEKPKKVEMETGQYMEEYLHRQGVESYHAESKTRNSKLFFQ
ncbi:unnamed protein product [Calicophoron daubneyi]|uniref:Ig-like domain-containing protein n=1 Tax=Calicophoron daubneyi TaxID=300641 RepID=A0AAV2TY48_CALDB